MGHFNENKIARSNMSGIPIRFKKGRCSVYFRVCTIGDSPNSFVLKGGSVPKCTMLKVEDGSMRKLS